METQGPSQKILAKIEELKQDYQRQSSYVESATRGIRTLRQELKRATLTVAKLEGAIEAYACSAAELEKPVSQEPVQEAQEAS